MVWDDATFHSAAVAVYPVPMNYLSAPTPIHKMIGIFVAGAFGWVHLLTPARPHALHGRLLPHDILYTEHHLQMAGLDDVRVFPDAAATDVKADVGVPLRNEVEVSQEVFWFLERDERWSG